MNASPKRPGRRLRMVAGLLLLFGIFGADGVYWVGTRSANPPNPLATKGYDKAQARQAEFLYGRQAIWIKDLTDDLKEPGTQAGIVVVTAVLAAGGCLYFAHLTDERNENKNENN